MSKHRDRELVEERPSRKYGTNPDGFEYPDPTPVEMPTRLKLPQRQVDRVRDIIRRELSAAAEAQGFESFDEADDFELEGEDPISPYEIFMDPDQASEEDLRKAVNESLTGQAAPAQSAPNAPVAPPAKPPLGSAEPA